MKWQLGGSGKCLGSRGKFRDFCLVSTVTLLPSHQLDFTALIFGDKKWMEDAQWSGWREEETPSEAFPLSQGAKLGCNLADMLTIKGAPLPRVPSHMDLLRVTCMCRAQVPPAWWSGPARTRCVQGGGVAVPVSDHAGGQGHGRPRRLQDHQGSHKDLISPSSQLNLAGWVALIPSLYKLYGMDRGNNNLLRQKNTSPHC